MNQTISVIVPVYNVANYLPACLDSLCRQTYRDLEILIVDDGSTDASGKICDQYAKQDHRIRVIHQKNGGAANAKNTALRMASGQYLTFADSDDYVEPDAYAYMIKQLQSQHADVIQCGYHKVFQDHSVPHHREKDMQTMNSEAFLELFTTDWTCGLLWDKLYRRELFQGIFFEEGHKIDDEYFTYQGIMNTEKIILSSKIVYNYRMRRSSVMSSRSSMEQIVLDRLDVLQKRRRNVVDRYPNLKKAYDDHYANSLLLLLKDVSATKQSILQTQRQIGAFLSERPCPKIGLRMKLQLLHAQHMRIAKILSEIQKQSPQQDLTMYFD